MINEQMQVAWALDRRYNYVQIKKKFRRLANAAWLLVISKIPDVRTGNVCRSPLAELLLNHTSRTKGGNLPGAVAAILRGRAALAC